jgi:hypothetical protein
MGRTDSHGATRPQDQWIERPREPSTHDLIALAKSAKHATFISDALVDRLEQATEQTQVMPTEMQSLV